jgi:hypothetical protein
LVQLLLQQRPLLPLKVDQPGLLLLLQLAQLHSLLLAGHLQRIP